MDRCPVLERRRPAKATGSHGCLLYTSKRAIGRRIQGFVAARDIVAPLTGELLCAAGEKISAETAMAAEKSGVSLVLSLIHI